jgi:glucosylceramidase
MKVKLAITVVACLALAPAAVAAHRGPSPAPKARRVAGHHSRESKAHRVPGPEASVTLTTPDLRSALSPMPAVAFGRIDPHVGTIDVSDATRYQTITGFGAAMTDASAWLLYDELPTDIRNLVMASLFRGIDLDYIRVPMAASDFSAGGVPYSYDDMPAGETDPTLAHFSIVHDEAYIIPALRQVLGLNPGIQFLAEPWSLPAWMKANDALDNDNYAGDLLPGDYQAGADYFVRFIQAYGAAGIPIAAVTPMNEAHTPSLYPGMNLDEDGFITQNLVPALRAAGLNTEVYGLDGSGLPYAEDMLEDPAVSPDIAGIAWHCYTGLDQMTTLHELDPTAGLIMSECSPGIVDYTPAETVIASMRNYASAVDLWNLALDPNGGPKQPVPGCPDCGALVTVDENTHLATLTPSFYEVGQVSKFVQRGAVRIASDRWVQDYSNSDGSYGVTSGLDNVAFENPHGSKVLVATNNSEEPIHFQVQWRDRAFEYTLGSGATVTFVWR